MEQYSAVVSGVRYINAEAGPVSEMYKKHLAWKAKCFLFALIGLEWDSAGV
ncbi:hypothetical protein l11_19880 [Neisseria weaveri LMG 5135]|nr:hypothetical protein l11_19880 [Neisseria weaveri LMG 5135]EGV38159.1 hypothetical protein l13_01730 [Neisseria weaveri ATCC 51223]